MNSDVGDIHLHESLYVGGDVTRARWDYRDSPSLGTFTATARERSSATAQCNAGGGGSSLVEVTREQKVHKGAPGGVVITSNQDGKNPLLRGAVLTITFDMRNSTHVTKRTIAHEVMCCVCMDRPPVVWQAGEQVACPLGHNAVCEECLPVLYQNRQPCPICREPWIAEAVAPIRERADAKARAELAAWRAAELEREAAELAHFQAMQAAEAEAEAAARAAALGHKRKIIISSAASGVSTPTVLFIKRSRIWNRRIRSSCCASCTWSTCSCRLTRATRWGGQS